MMSRGEKKSRLDTFLKECRCVYETMCGSISNDITSKDDLIMAMHCMGRNPSKANMKCYWSKHTELVSYDEFCDYVKQENEIDENFLLRAFEQVDPNGDGFIERDELERILLKFGERMTQSELKELLNDFPYDDKGRFPFEEFCSKFAEAIDECQQYTKRKGGRQDGKRYKTVNQKPRISKRQSSTISLAAIKEQKHTNASFEEEAPRKSSITSLTRDRTPSISRERTQSISKERIQPSSRERTHSMSKERKPSLSRKESIASSKKFPATSKFSVTEPKNLKAWHTLDFKGNMFSDDRRKYSSNQYKLELATASAVWITISSQAPVKELADVDLEVYLYKEEGNEIKEYVQCSGAYNKGRYCIRTDLRSGNYRLIPFTSGCIFRQRVSNSKSTAKLVKDTGKSLEISQQFLDALHQAFDLFDLDGNGSLNFEEFNDYFIRANNEDCDAETWQHVKESYEIKNDELTRAGFISIHEQEALDNPDDIAELWLTLHGLGFNNSLIPDEVCPFAIEICTENCEGNVEVKCLRENVDLLDRGICANIVASGTSKSINDLKDLQIWTYQTEKRISIAISNQMKNPMAIKLDCSESKNCITNMGDLQCMVKVKPGEVTVGMHLMPADSTKDWNVICRESLDQL